jgi:competence protein ComEC
MSKHLFFWRQHPALLYSLTLLIGAASALFWPSPWNWLFPALWALYLIFIRKWPLLLLLPLMAAYCLSLYKSEPKVGSSEGIFSISVLKPHRSPFARGALYQGTLYTKKESIPCSIYTHGPLPPYPATCDYFVEGRLDKRGSHQYVFKPKEWVPIENSFSFAQARYLLKQRYRSFLAEQFQNSPRAAEFLGSLTTGDVEDRLLKYEFGRLGLQHLLAISGFHFGVLIAFSSLFLSLFLPRFWKLLLLCICLTAYYLFVGPFPAVQRSWLTAIAYLTGKLLNRQTSGLNLLGLTLGVEVALNPLIVSNLGFQFSFASAGGILLLHSPLDSLLSRLIPSRPAYELPALSKHTRLIAGYFRQAMALNFAVNLTILPILLTHFHIFPLLSLLYNLFFPFALGLVLSALLLSLSLHLLVPFLSPYLFAPLGYVTDQLLNVAAYPPALLDYSILVPNFPAWTIPFYLFFLILIAIDKTFDE